MKSIAPLIIINAVGMTSRLLAHASRLQSLAQSGWSRSLRETLPAVTCTAQASLLTGKPPSEHGVVANGWLFRDTMEVRFWQQSNRLIEAEPFYVTARREATKEGRRFRCAKLFWWFNQGADVEFSVTPKPHYGADGNKAFGVTGQPEGLCEGIEKEIGKFPFPAFWGPNSGLKSTAWIARCAAKVVRNHQPELSLVYLPHLDYEPQRRGPSGCDMKKHVAELDDSLQPLLDAAKNIGARIWVVSEYGHCDVDQPVYLNRELRQSGWLQVRMGPFGEQLETFASEAFAVCDHQLAHVYVRRPEMIQPIGDKLASLSGVGRVYFGEERAEIGLNHPRSGEIVVLSKPNAWFAYPFWLEHHLAPDYARCIDIHRKPGFDPCELFYDPKLLWPIGRAIRRLLQKKLGFRTLFDVIPLNASLVRGSHGLPATHEADRPILIGTGVEPGTYLSILDVNGLVLQALRSV
ncbi:MAG TPA: alkaline phosphatase family protein [Gemmatales bacterium]|nr:alkaline phosphatase family protein [Gemmatales bacterium]